MKVIRTYYLEKALRDHRDTIDYKGWPSVKTILVLFDENPERPSPHLSVLKHLEGIGPKIDHLVYSATKKPKENVPECTYFKGDVSYFGRPKKQILNQLAQADVLIDWTGQAQSPNDFLVATHAAGFKVGIDRDLPCFDLVVKGGNNAQDDIVNEIVNYLKLINK